MANPVGMPIWYELLTSDVDGAGRFYREIVGWSAMEMPMPAGGDGGAYAILSAGDGAGVGGLMALPDGASTGPSWFAYFHVEDVDARVAENEEAGGATHVPPRTMDGVGRIAMIADPQGVVFYLMKPQPPADRPDARSTVFSETLPGRCAWNELVTGDQTAALPFYQSLLGWTSDEVMPMGPMGDYTFLDCAGTRIGAMMNRAAPEQPTKWTFYFKVADVDAAAARIGELGGTVMMGPMEVPGGQRVVLALDPQGASVGFVSGERQ